MFHLIRIVVFVVTTWTMSAATSGIIVGTTTLTIDGVPCGVVHAAEGGDPRATVVVEAASGSALPKKHLGSITYDPITIVMGFPLPPPVLECIKALCMKRSSRKTLVLAQYDHDFNLIGRPLEASNALLTEVRFPALGEAGKSETARVTLIFTPQSTKTAPSASASPPKGTTAQPRVFASNYKIAIGALPTARVTRIEPFWIKLAAESAPPEFSNLTLTVDRIDDGDWNTWRDSFIVKGSNDDASEKTGTLELLAGGTATTAAESAITFQFSHVGLVRTKAVTPAPSDELRLKFQAELYYETLNLAGPSPRPLTAVTAVAPVTVAGAAVQTPVASTPAAPTPVASAPVGGIKMVSNPADQGGRDPKDFPRLEGTVRKTYSSIQQRTSLQEMVMYSSRESLDALEQSYMKTLEAAGWEFITRAENNDAVGRMHQIIVNWKNGLRSVAITFTEVKAGGSEIGVNLTTKI